MMNHRGRSLPGGAEGDGCLWKTGSMRESWDQPIRCQGVVVEANSNAMITDLR